MMTKKIIHLVSLLAIFSGVFLTIQAIKGPIAQPEEKIILQDKHEVSREDIAIYTKSEGSVVSQKEETTTQASSVSGKIDSINIKEGDSVTIGDIVATVTVNETSQAAITQAKNLVNNAQNNLNNAINSPDTQLIEYWDQSVVDLAEAHLASVIAESNEAVSNAQSKIENLSEATSEIASNDNKNEIRSDLIESYYDLDQSIWNYNQVKDSYFVRRDQWSIRVQEKLSDALGPYFSAQWYMDNHVLGNAPDWAITDCLNYTTASLQKLSLAYNTMADAIKDPVYAPIITDEDREIFNTGRNRTINAYSLAINAKIEWDNVGPITEENKRVEATNIELENIKTKAVNDIAIANQALNVAYQNALKTKTITIAKNTIALERALKNTQDSYNMLLDGKDATYELRAEVSGIVSDIFITNNAWIDAKSNILTISTKTGLNVIAEKNNFNNIELFAPVEIVFNKNVTKGAVTDITESLINVSFENCNEVCLEEGDSVVVKIKTTEKINALVIPNEYLIKQEDKDFVEIEIEGEIVLREIRLGIINNEFTEILEGVKQGDTVFLPEEK